MAQKVQVVLIDDIDGGDASETVTFGLDGVTYEIDLNDKNAAKLRDAFSLWVGSGRRSPAVRRVVRSLDRTSPRRWLRGHRGHSRVGQAERAHRSASAAVSRPPSATPTTPRTELRLLAQTEFAGEDLVVAGATVEEQGRPRSR